MCHMCQLLSLLPITAPILQGTNLTPSGPLLPYETKLLYMWAELFPKVISSKGGSKRDLEAVRFELCESGLSHVLCLSL